MKQISSYINKLASCPQCKDTAIIGPLLTSETFQYYFSVLKFEGTGEAVLLTPQLVGGVIVPSLVLDCYY